METYDIAITNPAHVAGITAAREAYNAALSALAEGEDGEQPLVTNEEYVQFVMARAAESYARQYGTE